MTFEKPDYDTFQCLSHCISAAKSGGLAPCVINGANEQAVELFLSGKIGFLKIAELVGAALENVKTKNSANLNDIEEADMMAREYILGNYQFKGHVTSAVSNQKRL